MIHPPSQTFIVPDTVPGAPEPPFRPLGSARELRRKYLLTLFRKISPREDEIADFAATVAIERINDKQPGPMTSQEIDREIKAVAARISGLETARDVQIAEMAAYHVYQLRVGRRGRPA